MSTRRWTLLLMGDQVDLQLTADQAPGTAQTGAEQEELVQSILFSRDDPQVRAALLEIEQALTGRQARAPASPFEVAGERSRRETLDLLRSALQNGRLQADVRQPAKVNLPLNPLGELIPEDMRPREVEEILSNFEVGFFDEVGDPIDDLEVLFTNRGKTESKKTDGQGIARFDNFEGSFGTLTVKDPQKLADIIESRLTEDRPKVKLTGDFQDLLLRPDLPHIQMESGVRKNVVVRPQPGHISMQLFDKTGQFAYAGVDYEISGPKKFEGTTDDQGRLAHEDVPKGDYTIEFTVEFDEAFRRDPLTLKAEVVVLDVSDTEPQIRQIGEVPYVRMARLRGLLFDTNKTFLLPTAIESLKGYRRLHLKNGPANLLIVGHTDTTGEANINDPLSVARAESVRQYLQGKVQDWLDNYSTSKKASERWGGREDRLMIAGICDAETRAREAAGIEPARVHFGSQKPILWYQSRHNEQVKLGEKPDRSELKADGVSGPKTREELVLDYMALLGEAWDSKKDAPLVIATMGLGEEVPLDSTGLALDERAVAERDNEEDPLDRRAEFFFFDPKVDIEDLAKTATKDDYLKWRNLTRSEEDANIEGINNQATILPLRDAHFRTGSAVLLPEGEAPGDDGKTALTSVGALATVLRFNEERPGHRLLVAGHTDSVGSDKDNDKLSEKRAQLVHAVLTGDRDTFVTIAKETGKVEDWKQILKWTSVAFPAVTELETDDPEAASEGSAQGDSDSEPEEGKLGTGFSGADPGPIDGNAASSKQAVKNFQTAYNENHKFLGGSGTITVDGDVGKQTWGAIFDLYQYNMALELGETFDGVKTLRDRLEFLPDTDPFVGFGEHHPADGNRKDAAESQVNRRVEVLLFEEGHEPDVAVLKEAPELSEIYSPDAFRRAEIEGDSAKRGAFEIKPFFVRVLAPEASKGAADKLILIRDGSPKVRVVRAMNKDPAEGEDQSRRGRPDRRRDLPSGTGPAGNHCHHQSLRSGSW